MLRRYWLEVHVVNADRKIDALLLDRHLGRPPCFSYEKRALTDPSLRNRRPCENAKAQQHVNKRN